jgi:hypothetical protein
LPALLALVAGGHFVLPVPDERVVKDRKGASAWAADYLPGNFQSKRPSLSAGPFTTVPGVPGATSIDLHLRAAYTVKPKA